MKTPEEIQVLAEKAFQDELIKSNQNINWIGYGKGIDGTSKERWIELWIKGYTKYQEDNSNKKYTEEDLIKAKINCYKYYTEWNEEVASDAQERIIKLTELLNKYNG